MTSSCFEIDTKMKNTNGKNKISFQISGLGKVLYVYKLNFGCSVKENDLPFINVI